MYFVHDARFLSRDYSYGVFNRYISMTSSVNLKYCHKTTQKVENINIRENNFSLNYKPLTCKHISTAH